MKNTPSQKTFQDPIAAGMRRALRLALRRKAESHFKTTAAIHQPLRLVDERRPGIVQDG
jgi:hypothetical protein